MTNYSDRQSDAFDNPAKMACREGNLRALGEAAFLTGRVVITIVLRRSQR
jgi:hypothetical protein